MENEEKTSLAKAVEQFTRCAEQPFRLKQILDSVQPLIRTAPAGITDRVETLLQRDLWTFYDWKKALYVPRHIYFHKARFRISPLEEEIEQGILIPGHRLIPFCSREVLPGTCTLKLSDGSSVRKKKITWPLEETLVYHTLLGWQNMLYYFVCDDESNADALAESNDPEIQISLTTFDLKEVYRQCGFHIGDTFIFTVEDWMEGEYSLTYSPAAEFEADWASFGKRWCKTLEDALDEVFDDLGALINMDEQLAWGFFYGGKFLIENPCIHIGGFLKQSQRVEICQLGTAGILWRCGEKPEAEALFQADIANNTMTGDADSLEAILEDLGIALREAEMEAYMRDELYRGGDSLELVLQRCLASRGELVFYDDVQHSAFFRFINALWSDVKENYNRFTDRRAGKYRSRALEIVDTHLAWLRGLDSKRISPADLPGQQVVTLAQIMTVLCSLLEALNAGDTEEVQAQSHLPEMIQEMGMSARMLMEIADQDIQSRNA